MECEKIYNSAVVVFIGLLNSGKRSNLFFFFSLPSKKMSAEVLAWLTREHGGRQRSICPALLQLEAKGKGTEKASPVQSRDLPRPWLLGQADQSLP